MRLVNETELILGLGGLKMGTILGTQKNIEGNTSDFGQTCSWGTFLVSLRGPSKTAQLLSVDACQVGLNGNPNKSHHFEGPPVLTHTR